MSFCVGQKAPGWLEAMSSIPCSSILVLGSAGPEIVMHGGKESKFTLHPRSRAGRTMFGVVVQLWRFLFSRGQEL